MIIWLKMWPINCAQGFSKIWPSDLVFDCYQQSQIDKDEDISSLKMKWENSDQCWCEKILVLLDSKLLTIGTAN